MKPQILLFATGLMFLGGCAVGPNYHLPDSAVPQNWSEPQLGGATNSPLQMVQWWKTFNDPELNSLIERAVKANYNLRLARGRVLEARATRSEAVADFAPTLNASSAYT